MIGSGGESGGSGSSSGGGCILKKGPWTGAEDEVLIQYVRAHGEGNWNAVQKHSGLNRCGKSCRLRWANHLRPNLKKGSFNPDEERLILELHSKYGNKWARMATQLPGRTDNEIKNYWNTRVKRRKRQGLPLYPNDINNQNQNQHQHQHQIPSPTTITSSTTTMTPTPTPPTTPSNFPFHYLSPTSFSNVASQAPAPPSFSFQYRPVPLLSVPPPSFAGFSSSYDGGQSSAASSHLPSPAAVTPESQFHHHNQHHQMMAMAPERIQHRHLHHHSSGGSSSGGGLLDDILENLLDENHISPEVVVKEEGREHMNGLPEDLSKFLNFTPTNTTHHVAPPHWYNHGGSGEIHPDDSIGVDMQQLATYFPIATSEAASAATTPTTNYSGQNPATWDTLPGIGKGWFKHN